MERHKSALKAARQAEKRRARNQSQIAAYRTAVKKFRALMGETTASKNKTEAAPKLKSMFSEVQALLMKAGSKNLINTGTASRKVARLGRAMHQALS